MPTGEYNGNMYLICADDTVTDSTIFISSMIITHSEGIKESDTVDWGKFGPSTIETGSRLYFMLVTLLEKQNINGYITDGDEIALYNIEGEKKIIKYYGEKIPIEIYDQELRLIFIIGYAKYKSNIFITNIISINEIENFIKNKVRMVE
jgi:hypothetical protein